MSVRDKLESMVVFALAGLAMLVLVPLILLVVGIAFLWREPRISVGVALSSLVVTAIALAAGAEGVAEAMAVYSYFFLALGLFLMLIRYVREGPGETD